MNSHLHQHNTMRTSPSLTSKRHKLERPGGRGRPEILHDINAFERMKFSVYIPQNRKVPLHFSKSHYWWKWLSLNICNKQWSEAHEKILFSQSTDSFESACVDNETRAGCSEGAKCATAEVGYMREVCPTPFIHHDPRNEGFLRHSSQQKPIPLSLPLLWSNSGPANRPKTVMGSSYGEVRRLVSSIFPLNWVAYWSCFLCLLMSPPLPRIRAGEKVGSIDLDDDVKPDDNILKFGNSLSDCFIHGFEFILLVSLDPSSRETRLEVAFVDLVALPLA